MFEIYEDEYYSYSDFFLTLAMLKNVENYCTEHHLQFTAPNWALLYNSAQSWGFSAMDHFFKVLELNFNIKMEDCIESYSDGFHGQTYDLNHYEPLLSKFDTDFETFAVIYILKLPFSVPTMEYEELESTEFYPLYELPTQVFFADTYCFLCISDWQNAEVIGAFDAIASVMNGGICA